MNKLHTFAALLAITMVSAFSTSALAEYQVTKNCHNNTDGRRKSIQCTYTQPQLGIVWKGESARARKLYVSKPKGDTGEDIVRLWINGTLRGEYLFKPGDTWQIFRKKHESTIKARVEVETITLPDSGPSVIYVHFETLDPPVEPDLSQCSNTYDSDRQSVCWRGNF